MKPLLLALTLSLLTISPALGETIVDGVVYPEITDLGKPRVFRSQPPASAPYVAQLPQAATGYRSTTVAPADLRPTLAGSTAQQAVAVPYSYGHGYVSVGSPQKVVQVIQPIGYTNAQPQPQVTYVQPVSYAQPLNVQPLTNLQPLTATPYNPYAQTTRGVPWRPIVNVRSMPPNYVVGQGIIGQPKVYVPNQPLRNFLRYVTP